MTQVEAPRTLGLLIKAERLARGWSQTSLADRAGVSRRWLTDMESGKPTSELGLMLRTLAALDLELHVLPGRPGSSPADDPGDNGVDLDELLSRIRGENEWS